MTPSGKITKCRSVGAATRLKSQSVAVIWNAAGHICDLGIFEVLSRQARRQRLQSGLSYIAASLYPHLKNNTDLEKQSEQALDKPREAYQSPGEEWGGCLALISASWRYRAQQACLHWYAVKKNRCSLERAWAPVSGGRC